jgi:hypothetical protein
VSASCPCHSTCARAAVEGDTNAAGQPVWFSGSGLAPDLSYPRIRQRLTNTEAPPVTEASSRRQPNPWHQATAAAEHVPHHLDHSDDAVAQAHLAAFGEALDALPLLAPRDLRPLLRQAAEAFERATRSRIRAQDQHARTLRRAVRDLRTAPVTGDGTGLALFLNTAVIVVIAAARWHQLRHHDQQAAAAHQTLTHLQAAYRHAATAPLTALTRHTPPAHTTERHAQHLRAALPDHADQVLTDPAWPALAAVLTDAETAGHHPQHLLEQAAGQRFRRR